MKNLYSNNVDPSLQAIVKAIPAPNGDEFRSRKFQRSDHETLCWLEAWKDPNSQKWTLEEKKIAPGIYTNEEGQQVFTDTQEESKTLLSNVCFFDVLFECAEFEVAELSLNSKTKEKLKTLGVEHFRAFASEQGIPFSSDGLPVPAAGGRTLVPGKFAPGALETAKKTRNIELLKINEPGELPQVEFNTQKIPLFDQQTSANNNPVESQAEFVKKNNELVKYKEHTLEGIDHSIKAIEAIQKKFNAASKGKFKNTTLANFDNEYFTSGMRGGEAVLGANVPSGVVLGFFTALAGGLGGGALASSFLFGVLSALGTGGVGLALPILAYVLPRIRFTNRQLDKSIKKLRTEANKYDGEQREAILAYADNVELGVSALKARVALKSIKKGSKSEKNKASSRLEEFNVLALAQGRDPGEIENFNQAISSNLDDDGFEKQIASLVSGADNSLIAPLKKQKQLVEKNTKKKQDSLKHS